MCGRKTLTITKNSIVKKLKVDEWKIRDYRPSYNICPTQYSPVLIMKEKKRIARSMKWGLIPEWSKNDSFSSKMINARAETLSEKPSFKNLIHRRRCVVLADGYFEWKRVNREKIPYYINPSNEPLFLMAGLWTIWRSDTSVVQTYTIITIPATNIIAHIHHRMPLILCPSKVNKWIDCEKYYHIEIDKSLESSKLNLSQARVGEYVNNASNNSAKCIEPNVGSKSLKQSVQTKI